MNNDSNSAKVLGRLSSLIEDYSQLNCPLSSIISSNILMEISSIILPISFEEQIDYFIKERKVLLQALNLFHYENKVSLVFIFSDFMLKIHDLAQSIVIF